MDEPRSGVIRRSAVSLRDIVARHSLISHTAEYAQRKSSWGTLRYSALRAAELALAAARQGLRQSSPTPPGATALLGVQHKACGLLNVSGFYNPLLVFLDHAVEQRFVRAEHRDMIVIDDDPVRLIRRLKTWTMPEVSKWMDRKPD